VRRAYSRDFSPPAPIVPILDTQEALLYHCAIELAGCRVEHLETLATRRRYAIIGRNFLRHVVLRLDGPRRTLTLTIPGDR
jgi:hypothetical protein